MKKKGDSEAGKRRMEEGRGKERRVMEDKEKGRIKGCMEKM